MRESEPCGGSAAVSGVDNASRACGAGGGVEISESHPSQQPAFGDITRFIPQASVPAVQHKSHCHTL